MTWGQFLYLFSLFLYLFFEYSRFQTSKLPWCALVSPQERKRKSKWWKRRKSMLAAPFFFLSLVFSRLLFWSRQKKKGRKKNGKSNLYKEEKKSGMSPAESGRREVDEERSDWTKHIRTCCSLYLEFAPTIQLTCKSIAEWVDYSRLYQCRVCWMDVGRCVEKERESAFGWAIRSNVIIQSPSVLFSFLFLFLLLSFCSSSFRLVSSSHLAFVYNPGKGTRNKSSTCHSFLSLAVCSSFPLGVVLSFSAAGWLGGWLDQKENQTRTEAKGPTRPPKRNVAFSDVIYWL